MRVVRVVDPRGLEGALLGFEESLGWAWLEALDLGEAAELARGLCPVETGALRDSIRWRRVNGSESLLAAGGEGYIDPRTGGPLDYAVAVHEGSRSSPPRPFLLWALASLSPLLVEKALQGVAHRL